jgi:hypothetical protein
VRATQIEADAPAFANLGTLSLFLVSEFYKDSLPTLFLLNPVLVLIFRPYYFSIDI